MCYIINDERTYLLRQRGCLQCFTDGRNMDYFRDNGLLFLYGLMMLQWVELDRTFVFAILAATVLICSMYFMENKYVKTGICVIYGLLSVMIPDMCGFYPVLLYALLRETGWKGSIAGAFVGVYVMIRNDFQMPEILLYLLLGFLISAVLETQTDKYNKLDNKFRRIIDDSEERTILLAEKNEALLEKQNYEIYAATLRERNRIAREIHDNVGHVLSRTILLTGAARTVNKDSQMDALLKGLDESLNSAMDSIRSSVHDLHDDAVNLEETIKGIIWDFKQENVEMKYDMSEIIPRDIKYCFISIVKEGLSNAMKYSGASRITITMREHPAMYQLCIEDNGCGFDESRKDPKGMGLKNMQERVRMLKGTIQISGDKGVRIFVVIPKRENIKNEVE